VQYSIPTLKAAFSLVAPEGLKFEVKGYNGLPLPIDTILDQKHFYTIGAINIPGVLDEQYSNYEANLMKVDYRLSYVRRENPNVRLFTWNDLAKQLYSDYYGVSDRENRIVKKFLQSIAVSDADNEDQKIRKIEDGLKSKIVISEDISDESFLNFDKIVDKKVTTEKGFVRFFVACLQAAGVEHEFGLTTNKFEHPLDDKFEVWKLLDIYVIYLPRQKKYLAPSSVFNRMPFLPPAAVGNRGIFCKLTTIGEITTAIASVRAIPELSFENSNNDIEANVVFDEEMTPVVTIKQALKGYNAMGIREAFIYTPKEKEKELVQDMLNIASKPEDIKSYSVENTAFTNYYDNVPLNIIADVTSSQLIEKAGPKYLFRVGDIIGRQAEMYQAKERKLPIDMPYAHSLNRKITVNIPQGYRVINPEVVRMLIDDKQSGDKQTMAFISDYKMEGNKMVISIREFYSQAHYPVANIEAFKNVINAAADFNKVVLAFEKIN
jgi:hypothetical protein